MGLVSPRTYQLKTVLVILLREYNFPPATHKNQNRDKSVNERKTETSQGIHLKMQENSIRNCRFFKF